MARTGAPKKDEVVPDDCTGAELARIIGRTINHVSKLTLEGVLSRTGRNTYHLAGSVQAYVKHGLETQRSRYAGESESKTRLMTAKAALAELELAQQRKELIRADQVIPTFRAAGEQIKIRLMAIPTRVAPRLGSAKNATEAAQLIREEIILALGELSRLPDAGKCKEESVNEEE